MCASAGELPSTNITWKSKDVKTTRVWKIMSSVRKKQECNWKKITRNVSLEKFQPHVLTSTSRTVLTTSMRSNLSLTTNSDVITLKLQISPLTLIWLNKHTNMPVTFRQKLKRLSIHQMRTGQTKAKTSTGSGHQKIST